MGSKNLWSHRASPYFRRLFCDTVEASHRIRQLQPQKPATGDIDLGETS
jgi:hypothetical protein